MKDYLTEKGEVYASEKIVRYDRDTLAMVWGDPVGELSGMDGQIWQVDNTASIVIYFDGDTASNTKILWHDEENGSGVEIEADGLYQILYAAGQVMFYFFPVVIGFNTSKKLGGNPYLGMMLGAGLIYPTIQGVDLVVFP